MRAVLDTNVVVSGLLWQGRPRQLLDAARNGRVEVFTLDLKEYRGIPILTVMDVLNHLVNLP